jgi:5'-nucleotidase
VAGRIRPSPRPYFWLRGEFINFDPGTDTDEWALAHNYVSIVPCKFDLTAVQGLADLSAKWQLPLPEADVVATPPRPIPSEDYGVAAPE